MRRGVGVFLYWAGSPGRRPCEIVISAFGPPARIAKLGVKEIFYYKDIKVTFTNGKVSNVELNVCAA
jgi:hypothetical protein